MSREGWFIVQKHVKVPVFVSVSLRKQQHGDSNNLFWTFKLLLFFNFPLQLCTFHNTEKLIAKILTFFNSNQHFQFIVVKALLLLPFRLTLNQYIPSSSPVTIITKNKINVTFSILYYLTLTYTWPWNMQIIRVWMFPVLSQWKKVPISNH